MIKFACFVPHSPLLVPEIGRENIAKLEDTIKAYKNLEQELYASNPDFIIIISSHANRRKGPFFTINQNPSLKVSFKDFGDLITALEYENEIGVGYKIKEFCETVRDCPVIMTADEYVDYGTGIPLFMMTSHLKDKKVVSIGHANLPPEAHFNFGQMLRRRLDKSSKRIAIIASGDLSHKLHQDSPSGYSPRGQEFDQAIIKNLNDKKIDAILNLDKDLVSEAGECGYRSLLILLGVLSEINYKPEKLSYESPFGIGYLTQHFHL